MAITIRRKDNGAVFDIPSDFTFEVNNTSPIFNDIGSKSIPVSLPRTNHNARLLGCAHRTDIVLKPTGELEVIVSEGSYMRDGMLYLNAASNTEDSYSVTIAFNEGIMYNKMKSIKLPYLPNLATMLFESQDKMMEYLNHLLTYDDPLADALTIFPIRLKNQGTYKATSEIGTETEYIVATLLNEVDEHSTPKKLKVNTTVKHAEGSVGIDISVPVGYGISPFVRVWYVLDLIFAHFGYRIGKNAFKTEFQLRRLVVLNNTIDAIVENQIKFSQLMPNVTIFEFFTSLFVRFGAKIFVDGSTNTVDIVLLRDILSSSPDSKLNVASLANIQYSDPKQLKLSCAKSLHKSSTSHDTYEEFLEQYNNTIGYTNDIFFWHGVNYYEPHGIFYQSPVGELSQSSSSDDAFWGKYKFLSSFHFDWNKQTDGIDTEEYTSVDEGLTMSGEFGKLLYYGIDYALRNSKLEIDLNVTSADIDNKLAFAFDFGIGYRYYDKASWGYKFGSIIPYIPSEQDPLIYFVDSEGNQMKYALSFIGKDGCFEHFHKQYDAILRHSNYEVTTQLDIPNFQLANINYQKMYNIHSQPMLIDKLDYVVGDFNTKEITARTTRLYEPYDLEAEHGQAKPDRIKYQWALQDGSTKTVADRTTHWEVYYKTNPPKSGLFAYSFISLKSDITAKPNPPSSVDLWYLPPTETQFKNQLHIGVKSHSLTVKHTLTYQHYVKEDGSTFGKYITDTYVFSESLDYDSYFTPVVAKT